jgi:glutamate dehydrogenase/leucine dehydrogenase
MKLLVLFAFLLNTVPVYAQAPELILPAPGQMVQLSKPFVPVSFKGLKVNPNNPMNFNFILHQGQNEIPAVQMQAQGMDLVKYFLAALTMPEKDVWVNLSPFENDRIIPQDLSLTLMGRDMLAQDYLLKQMTSSLLYPNDGVGQEFWKKVYAQAKSGFGGAQIPVSSFNKVWIMPDRAEVFTKGETVLITGSHLKVMLDHDYHASQKMTDNNRIRLGQQEVAERMMKELIVPVLEKEINEGAHFAPLRQIFQAAILAEWYKRHFRQGVLGQQYANQNKVGGIDETPAQFKDDLYKQYLQAYKKGVYNFIREDKDPQTGEIIPRKYFSGGVTVNVSAVYKEVDPAQTSNGQPQQEEFLDSKASFIDMQVSMDAQRDGQSEGEVSTPGQAISLLQNPFLQEWPNSFQEMKVHAPQDVHLDEQIASLLKKNVRVTGGWLQLSNGSEFYAVRVANNNLFGTPKGGIRWTKASDLMKDKEFTQEWRLFMQSKPNLQEAKQFIATWFTQEANALAIGMTLKTAGLRNRLGGGKADVFLGHIVGTDGDWHLEDMDETLVNEVPRLHTRQLVKAGAVGVKIDSPAPDVNTTPEIMALYTDEFIRAQVDLGEKVFMADVPLNSPYRASYKRLFKNLQAIKPSNEQTPYLDAVYEFWNVNTRAGKPIPVPWLGAYTGLNTDKGGVEGRTSATGDGVIIIAKQYFKSFGLDFYQKAVAIQGFGNVGIFTALAAAREGFKVKVISDAHITLIKEDGFSEEELKSIAALIRPKQGQKLFEVWKAGLITSTGIEAVINEHPEDKKMELKVAQAVLWADVDVLIPAAMQGVISKSNVDGIRAKLIVEAANNPVYLDALNNLTSRNIDVIPGILANAGGVYVSGLQMEQAITGRKIPLAEVSERLTKTLVEAMEHLLWWRKNVYAGSLYHAYTHHVLTLLNSRSILREAQIQIEAADKASLAKEIKHPSIITISQSDLVEKLPDTGKAIFDHLVRMGTVETIKRSNEIIGVFHRNQASVIATVIGGVVSGERHKQAMDYMFGGMNLLEFMNADSAMTNGGIDLNTASMTINEKGEVVNFNIPNIKSIERIQGLVPVFIRMQPISISTLLGL